MKLILASQSTRRKELLAEAGYDFEVVVSHVDESKFDGLGLSARELAEKLAFEKAREVAEKYPDELVIGADTLCECNGQIIGKPDSKEHAEKIIELLFQRPHRVITGLALINKSNHIEFIKSDSTVVYPRKMTEGQIRDHIAGGTWQGKAGAYAIQETGDEFVEKIEGSMTNVIGLPMELLESMLDAVNYD